jgi:hypothetical protein
MDPHQLPCASVVQPLMVAQVMKLQGLLVRNLSRSHPQWRWRGAGDAVPCMQNLGPNAYRMQCASMCDVRECLHNAMCECNVRECLQNAMCECNVRMQCASRMPTECNVRECLQNAMCECNVRECLQNAMCECNVRMQCASRMPTECNVRECLQNARPRLQ